MKVHRPLLVLAAGLLMASTATHRVSAGSPQVPVLATESAQALKKLPSLIGQWLGGLDVGGFELRLGARFFSDDGWLRGKLDIPQQNLHRMGLHSVRQEGEKIHFELMTAGGNIIFEGQLEGDKIRGISKQGERTLPFHLKRGEVTAMASEAAPYSEEEIRFRNGDVSLAGTLTRPRDVKLAPAVILISGSGPQNRDSFIMGMEPFKEIADDLARRGIAVLRFDDRGVGKSSGDFNAATTQDFATDVEAAFAFLKSRGDIDANHIGLMGHSEGGLIAPIVAQRNQDVAFVVLMAAPGVRGSEIVRQQSALVARAGGMNDAQIAANDALLTRAFDLIEAGKGLSSLKEEFTAVGRAGFYAMPEKARAQIGSPEAMASQQMKALESPWFRYFIGHDPAPALRRLKCPVLAVNGTKDMQVPGDANLAAISRALEAGKNKDFKTVQLPDLNHLFQTAKTGSPNEYAELEKRLAPSFLEVAGPWIEAHAGLKATP